MTLGEVIQKLSAMPPLQVMRPGFGRPTSYRGVYSEVAFLPVDSATVSEMLAHAKSAIGPVFVGYKGGYCTYDEDTPAHVAEYGYCTEDGSMDILFARNESAAEIATLRADLAKAREEVETLKKLVNDEGDAVEEAMGQRDAAERARDEALAESDRLKQQREDLGVVCATIQCATHQGRDNFGCSTCRGLRLVHEARSGRAWSLEHEVRQLKREAKDIGTFIDAAIADRDAFENRALAAERARDEAVAGVARVNEVLGELLDAQEHFDGTDEDHDRIERERAWDRLTQATKAARRALGRTDKEGT